MFERIINMEFVNLLHVRYCIVSKDNQNIRKNSIQRKKISIARVT
jgi:hypothetical protein